MQTAVFAAVLMTVAGTAIKWTGIDNDNQWTNRNNWYPAQVPGASDDVTIDDAEGKNAFLILTASNITIRSLSMGNLVSSDARLMMLSPLTITGTCIIRSNGHLEINSGGAVLEADCTVSGEFAFLAGTFKGNAVISGKANLGAASQKILDGSSITVTSPLSRPMTATGSIAFKGNSTITSTGAVLSPGTDFQCIVADSSVNNSFIASGGFSWKQLN